MAIKRLLMLTTGGTIGGNVASKAESGHVSNLHSVLAGAISQIKEQWAIDIEIESSFVVDVDSSDILPSHWTQIAEQIAEQYDNYDGFIVTHGTNTMGYTSAALSFAFQNLAKPVVITGSQVPFGRMGSDALTNLENALRVAVYPYVEFRGVVCVFGSHIITGTRAKKATEFDYDAFQSFSSASLGRIGRTISINDGNVQKHNSYSEGSNTVNGQFAVAQRQRDLIVEPRFDTSLISFTEFPGLTPAIFRTMLASAIDDQPSILKGIVFRAFGAGDVSTHLHPVFEYLRDHKIPVVVTTQAPNGKATFTVNKPGETLAREKLAIPAHDMSIESMTAKLAWLVGRRSTYDDICRIMIEDLHGEISVEPNRT